MGCECDSVPVHVINLCTVLDVKEEKRNEMEISIYPNPSTGEFIINLNKYYNNVNIKITDVLGKELIIERRDE